MPISNDNLNKKLYELLKTQGFDPIPKNSKGETTPVPEEADVFRFTFKVDGKPVGPAWITVDSNQQLKVYYDDEVMGGMNEDGGSGQIDDFTEFLQQLKKWAQRRQLGFDLQNQDHLESDMAQREHVRKQEQINEGYYPMGKSASYNDSVPSVKIILQHTRQIQEGEQRFRNIARIFLENTVGERILAPTTRPGIAKVYARHLAEGGLPHDDRWGHIGSLVEEYTKMAGFVRATKGNQFNESAQQLVIEGINHYQSLRETLSRMIGHKGYNAYFESWTPALMEDETDNDTLNELFVQETMDPRIESVMPILSRIHKKVNEMSEVNELAEWADSIVSEKMVMGASTDASSSGSFKMGEGALHNPGQEDSPVVNAITRRILMQRTDLLAKYGPEVVGKAIDSIADFVGDVDEIGSSDVSGWVTQVERELGSVQEGLGDVAKKVGGALKTGAKAIGKAIVGKDDDELLKDLQKKAGVRGMNHGKPSMAYSDVEKRVDEEEIEESGLQAYLGNKKYGKEGMDALRKAGREDASKEEMAKIRAKYDKLDEVDLGQYDAVKAPLKGKDTSDWDKNFREKLKQYTKELDQRQKEKKEKSEKIDEEGVAEGLPQTLRKVVPGYAKREIDKKMDAGKFGKTDADKDANFHRYKKIQDKIKEQGVAEGEFAGDYATGEAGQWRNKGPKAHKPAAIGDLVGENFINTDAQAVVSEMDSEGYKGTRDDYDLGKGKEHAGKPITSKKAVSDAEKIMNKAHDKMMKSMSDKEKVDKGHRNPNMKEGQEDLDAILRIIKK